MGILKGIRSKLKAMTIDSADLLPNKIYKRLVHAAPRRLLRTLSHASLRGKYEIPDLLPKSLWGISANDDNHMVIQGCDCVELARQYQTPLFVVDRPRLEENFWQFVTSFRSHYPRVEVGYSYKTNPLPGALNVLHNLGAWAEVVSPNELALALNLKVPARKIIYNGPGKSDEGLELAVASNIRMINIDGFSEIERLARLAEKYGHVQPVGIRVITSVGWVKKFGFSIKTGAAFKAFELLKQQPYLKPCGLHFHLSTGVNDVNTYLTAINSALQFTDQLKKKLDIQISFFDFGGGFDPVPTVHHYSPKDLHLANFAFPVQEPRMRKVTELETYGREIGQLVREHYHGRDDELPTLVFEPGRAITSSAQFLLLRVLDIKASENGVKDVILDGGRNVASPTVWECHPVFNASRINAPDNHYYTLYGPLCTPYDPAFQIKRLPQLAPDDILALMDTGAYFISMLSNFCSFPKPAAVMIEDGQHELIRRRETFSDLFGRDLAIRKQPSSARDLLSMIDAKLIASTILFVGDAVDLVF
jgi:diaminopimelate decarboxylase